MKKILSILLSIAILLPMLSGCGAKDILEEESSVALTSVRDDVIEVTDEVTPVENIEIDWDLTPEFSGLSDPDLVPYVEYSLYESILSELDSEEYFVENVEAIYISQEYLEEVAYNSRENVFFGYSLAELDEYYEGTRYVFTLGENGETIVEPLEVVEGASYTHMLKNVATGAGVILFCVTVSCLAGQTGRSGAALNAIFAASAAGAAVVGGIGAFVGGIAGAVVRGIETGDLDEALYGGLDWASEGFKWGAVVGAVAGGAYSAFNLYQGTANGLSLNDVAHIQKISQYPLDLIREFHSYEEFELLFNEGLEAVYINGRRVLFDKSIDFMFQYDGITNYERMLNGNAPVDINGNPYNLHHIGQQNDGTLAILTEGVHQGFYSLLHPYGNSPSQIDRPEFAAIRAEIWKKIGQMFLMVMDELI